MIYENDIEYARGRLRNTYVVYQGKLVFVVEVRRGSFSYKTSRQGENIYEGKLKDLDIKPMKLGYSNYKDNARYFMRIPARRWKQGIDNQSTYSVSTHNGDGGVMKIGDMKYVLKGEYPPIKVAKSVAERLNRPIAFSRTFAVMPDKTIEYKGKHIVGKINDFGAPQLSRKFWWLEEALFENG